MPLEVEVNIESLGLKGVKLVDDELQVEMEGGSNLSTAQDGDMIKRQAGAWIAFTPPAWVTQAEIDAAITALVDGAPGALDTLNELAAALNDDANFSATIVALIATKEPAIPTGTALQYIRGDKSLAVFPTSLGDFVNTPGFQTEAEVNSAIALAISNLIDGAPGALDTLNELAAALADDANFSATVTALIATKEPAIAPGTNLQYWRGDKVWATFPTNLNSFINGPGYLNEAAADALYYKKTGQLIIDGNGSIVVYIKGTTNVAYSQYQNSSTGTGTNDGLTIGMNGLNAVILNRENGPLWLGANDDVKIHLLNSGRTVIADSAGSITPTARLMLRSTQNGTCFDAQEDGGTSYVKFEEVSGIKRIGWNNKTPIARPVLPITCTAADIATVLDSLGHTSLI